MSPYPGNICPLNKGTNCQYWLKVKPTVMTVTPEIGLRSGRTKAAAIGTTWELSSGKTRVFLEKLILLKEHET